MKTIMINFSSSTLVEHGFTVADSLILKDRFLSFIPDKIGDFLFEFGFNTDGARDDQLSVFWDLALFPKSPEALKIILEKISASDVPLKFSINNNDKYNITSSSRILTDKPLAIKAENFLVDVTDTDLFFNTLRSLAKSRSFNSIQNSSDKKFLLKRSLNTEKLKAEFSFLEYASKEDFRYVKVQNLSIGQGFASYEVEAIDGMDLSRVFLSDRMTTNMIDNFFDFSASYFHDNIRNATSSSKCFVDFLLTKNKERMDQVAADIPQKNMLNYIVDRFTPYEGLSELFDASNKMLEKHRNEIKKFPNSLIHGDFCFSNILATFNIDDKFKLIDPRGYKELNSSNLNIYYDLAKLSHSINGGYDFAVNGKFQVQYDENLQVNFEIPVITHAKYLKDKFCELISNLGADKAVIDCIEASLFLSMLPLHSESSLRQSFFINQASERLLRYIPDHAATQCE